MPGQNFFNHNNSLPITLPCPHFRWFLSVLFSKYNGQFTTEKKLAIHMAFGICSIIWVYILDKSKAPWFPETSDNSIKKREKHILYTLITQDYPRMGIQWLQHIVRISYKLKHLLRLCTNQLKTSRALLTLMEAEIKLRWNSSRLELLLNVLNPTFFESSCTLRSTWQSYLLDWTLFNTSLFITSVLSSTHFS